MMRPIFLKLFMMVLVFISSSIVLADEPTPNEMLDAIWKVLKDNYPMFEYAGAYDDSWYKEAKAKIASITDYKEALPILDTILVKRLNDYHTGMYWDGKHEPEMSYPPHSSWMD
jgi:hypothetical protein